MAGTRILIDETLAGSSASAIHSHAAPPDGKPLCKRVREESLCGDIREGVPTCPSCLRAIAQ